jgi:hypothetical protein
LFFIDEWLIFEFLKIGFKRTNSALLWFDGSKVKGLREIISPKLLLFHLAGSCYKLVLIGYIRYYIRKTAQFFTIFYNHFQHFPPDCE